MHLFTALATAAPGRNRQVAQLMPKLRDAATAAHGIPSSAWAVFAGAPFGTFALTSRLEGTQQLLDATATLGGDAAWNKLSEEAASLFSAPAETRYSQVIAATSGELGASPIMVGTRAVISPGHVKAAVTIATSMLEFVGDTTGLAGVLSMSEAGQMNELTWIFGVDSAANGDAANAALAGNPEWLDMMDASGPNFEPGAERLMLVRLP